MRIDQVLVSASPGDAVTNSAFELRALLRRLGPSNLYARYFDPALHGDVLPLEEYGRRDGARPEADLLCFHASIGEPDVLSFLLDRPERLLLLYHNISPSEAFRPYDPRFADLLDLGRHELVQLAPRTHLALAVSRFNAAELEAIGYRDVRVSPLVVDPSRLVTVDPHPSTAHHLAHAVDGPLVLFVGQVLPHKRPDLLVQAYHVLTTYLLPDAHMAVVGPTRLEAYHWALQEYAHELNLPHLWITGAVSDAELAAFYRRADVFVTASEHEGFCVPLLEAMAFDVPVVARACAAVPETAGDAAVTVPPEDGPVLLAEALAAVLTEPVVADELRARGRRRLAAFAPDQARATFLAHLADVV